MLNFKTLKCPNCSVVLVPLWNTHKKPLWQRRLLVLAWSLPAIVAMTVVWLAPQMWLYLALSLVVFHIVALAVICVFGCYQVQIKP